MAHAVVPGGIDPPRCAACRRLGPCPVVCVVPDDEDVPRCIQCWVLLDDQSMRRYSTRVVNNRTGEAQVVTLAATGPESARAFALAWAFREWRWQSVSAAKPGEAE